jgi:hypothetical protein
MCINGQRTCINCDQIVTIDIKTNTQQRTAAIGEYRFLPKISTDMKTTPCLLQTGLSSHRLIFPGQQTWFERRCYFCSRQGGRLITC